MCPAEARTSGRGDHPPGRVVATRRRVAGVLSGDEPPGGSGRAGRYPGTTSPTARRRTASRRSSPRGYANRAVVNAALSWRRRRRVAEVPLKAEAHAPVQEPGDLDDVDPRLLAALWTLPPRTRAAVVLRYLEDCSELETAAALG